MESFQTVFFFFLLLCLGFLERVGGEPGARSPGRSRREKDLESTIATNGEGETTVQGTNMTSESLNVQFLAVNLAETLTNPKKYIKELPPFQPPEIHIATTMKLYHIDSISAQSSDFSVYLLLRHVWEDQRLNFMKGNVSGLLKREYISGSEWLYDLIWSPTLYFVNEKDSGIFHLSRRNVFVAIFMNGTARLKWENPKDCINREDFSFSEQTLINHECFDTELEDIHYVTGKNFSAIIVRFTIKRDPGHYILDYYLPSIFLIVVSWVNFWLDPSASPARVGLGTCTMLTFITLSRNIGDELPKLSYLRAVEIWFFVCISFIFLTLVEFAFANIIYRRGQAPVPLKKSTSKHILWYGLSPKANRSQSNSRKTRTKSEGNLDVPHSGYHGRYKDQGQLSVSSFDNMFLTRTLSDSMETLPMSNDDCKDIYIPVPSLQNDGNESSTSKPRQRKMSVLSVDWIKEKRRRAREEKEKKEVNREFKHMTPQEIAIWIDEKSRIVFPICFVIFCLLYWTLVFL
ncbi:unnamed protein product [Darwinula stevensoni]|uniref:Uncharacterized protein n=1 Tax=Darwinula stevensoni TaxID=69355 RepID=A0A7R8WZK6_9CRUS|nr:unnamed protein product [Darwinula stevensoni]CAG0880686.1 unnamed protein product [Darwinula stevensoni]